MLAVGLAILAVAGAIVSYAIGDILGGNGSAVADIFGESGNGDFNTGKSS